MILMLAMMVAALHGGETDKKGVEESRRASVVRGDAALTSQRPQLAIVEVQPVIDAYEGELRSEKRDVYCGMTMSQTLAVLTGASASKREAVALSSTFCDALYVKGFALFDLGRIDEAQSIYLRLVALAPMHAHFRTELAMTYRVQKKWSAMLDACKESEPSAGLAGEGRADAERAAAWRCQWFALIEQGDLDAAQALFEKCLAQDPQDKRAKNELDYIADQRRKAPRT